MVKKSSLLELEKPVALETTEQLQAIPVFHEAVQIVSRYLEVPIAYIATIQADTQWFRASVGFSCLGRLNALLMTQQIPSCESFCLQVMETRQALVIPDTEASSVFAQHRLTQSYKIRAYAGVPLLNSQGECLGTLAVMDLAPRCFDDRTIEFLTLTARWCMSEYAQLYGSQSPSPTTVRSGSLQPQEFAADRLRQSLLSESIQNLRTPLTTILGMTGMIRREVYGPLSPKQKEYLEIVAQCGQDLLWLSNEMLELSLLGATSPTVKVSAVDVQWLCQQTFHHLHEAAQRLDQQLHLTIEPGQRFYSLDKEKVRLMLHYLVAHFIQRSPAASEIQLHVSHCQEGVTLSIGVTHPWISDEDENDPSVAQPEEDASQETLSLGLQFSQQLAQLHGGQWSLEEASGRASIFLPAIAEQPSIKTVNQKS